MLWHWPQLHSAELCLQRCAHLLVNYFNADDCYTHYVKSNCPVIKGAYNKEIDFIKEGAKEPQEVCRSGLPSAVAAIHLLSGMCVEGL